MSRKLVRTIKAEREDAKNSILALSLQAKAWRQLALISIADPEYGRKHAAWLMFNSVPFVNGPVIEKFVIETEKLAQECGIKTGVFAPPRGEAA